MKKTLEITKSQLAKMLGISLQALHYSCKTGRFNFTLTKSTIPLQEVLDFCEYKRHKREATKEMLKFLKDNK